MKRCGSLFLVAVLVIALAPSAHPASLQGQTLRVQVWPGADALAIQKNVIDPFKKESGANVVVEEGNTSSSIAKARAQKNDPQLDVIFLDDIGVLTLLREGILEKLDLARMPHAKEIYPTYIVGDGYGIGIFNYITTIAASSFRQRINAGAHREQLELDLGNCRINLVDRRIGADLGIEPGSLLVKAVDTERASDTLE